MESVRIRMEAEWWNVAWFAEILDKNGRKAQGVNKVLSPRHISKNRLKPSIKVLIPRGNERCVYFRFVLRPTRNLIGLQLRVNPGSKISRAGTMRSETKR